MHGQVTTSGVTYQHGSSASVKAECSKRTSRSRKMVYNPHIYVMLDPLVPEVQLVYMQRAPLFACIIQVSLVILFLHYHNVQMPTSSQFGTKVCIYNIYIYIYTQYTSVIIP